MRRMLFSARLLVYIKRTPDLGVGVLETTYNVPRPCSWGNEVQICENGWKSAQPDFSCKNANNTPMYEKDQFLVTPKSLFSSISLFNTCPT